VCNFDNTPENVTRKYRLIRLPGSVIFLYDCVLARKENRAMAVRDFGTRPGSESKRRGHQTFVSLGSFLSRRNGKR